jgi:serine/threonine-protein kinase
MATVYLARDQSLRDRLRHESRLPVDEAVRIACEAAQALQYAHEHGVADFGIARALGGGDERLTDAGLAIGTPQSMSPEQATAER